MTGKITFIQQEQDYDQNQCYSLTFANGQTFKFYQLKELNGVKRTEFHKKVGEEIEFEISNAKYNTAKIITNWEKPEVKTFSKPKSQQTSIEWQSCLRSACLFYSNTQNVKSSTVLETTELFFNKLKQKTNE
jgi:hypothetical protein